MLPCAAVSSVNNIFGMKVDAAHNILFKRFDVITFWAIRKEWLCTVVGRLIRFGI